MWPTILVVACVYVPLGTLLVVVKVVGRDHHASVLIDPHYSPSESLTHGSLWVLGLAGWSWAVLMCVVGVIGAARRRSLRPMGRLLAGAGLLTLVMLLDDLLQLHKPVIPDATGLPSIAVLAAYALAFVAWVVVNRRAIVDSDVGVLIVAIAFFALWILVKLGPHTEMKTAVEAGAKLCGIAGWAAYVTLTAWRTRASSRNRGPGPATVGENA